MLACRSEYRSDLSPRVLITSTVHLSPIRSRTSRMSALSSGHSLQGPLMVLDAAISSPSIRIRRHRPHRGATVTVTVTVTAER